LPTPLLLAFHHLKKKALRSQLAAMDADPDLWAEVRSEFGSRAAAKQLAD